MQRTVSQKRGIQMTNDEEVRKLLESACSIAVLTGAGVSTDSGIPDFKALDGSWSYEAPRDVMLSLDYWWSNPERFWEVYREILGSTGSGSDLEPNGFHRWLVDLEDRGRVSSVSILTQNVDGLHSKAGSTRVIEAHGNGSRAICLECRGTVPMDVLSEDPVPLCADCGFLPMKPDVALFMEGISGVSYFRSILDRSDLLIVAGTSLEVGPVNELPLYAQLHSRIPTLWLNREPAPPVYSFSHSWLGELSEFSEKFQV